MKQRDTSLDALRGIAILAMVFSGSITYNNVLPAWMYHAQVPPPNHKFIETLAGITWVDLVFPFFLFSMGAAIPLALAKQVAQNGSFKSILLIAGRRFLLLTFFALFTQHMKPWVLATSPDINDYLLSIMAFLLLFVMLYNYKGVHYKKLFLCSKIIAFCSAIFLLYALPFGGKGFQFYTSDIIIIVLANMAFFGTIIWWFTKDRPWLRVGILPFVLAVFLAANEPVEGWQKTLYHFSQIGGWQFDWFYRFYFLKYLFIIIPGTFAGDWLLQQSGIDGLATIKIKRGYLYVSSLAISLIISTVIFLFTRQLVANLLLTIVLLTLLNLVGKKMFNNGNDVLYKFINVATYLLLLGLFFEAYEGGIKKDHSTYSYYFVTSGLAFLALVFFRVIANYKLGKLVADYLSLNGRNPMVAYVAGGLLITPLLYITNGISLFNMMNDNAVMGILKGVLFTALVSIITVWFTKKQWFWKT